MHKATGKRKEQEERNSLSLEKQPRNSHGTLPRRVGGGLHWKNSRETATTHSHGGSRGGFLCTAKISKNSPESEFPSNSLNQNFKMNGSKQVKTNKDSLNTKEKMKQNKQKQKLTP